jgi:hypothetical protein
MQAVAGVKSYLLQVVVALVSFSCVDVDVDAVAVAVCPVFTSDIAWQLVGKRLPASAISKLVYTDSVNSCELLCSTYQLSTSTASASASASASMACQAAQFDAQLRNCYLASSINVSALQDDSTQTQTVYLQRKCFVLTWYIKL